MHWHTGAVLAKRLSEAGTEKYGQKIVATVSQQLTWSHFIELITISNPTKRLYYQQMAILHHWSVRDMRHKEDEEMDYERALIAAQPEDIQTRKLLEATLPDTPIDPDLVFKSSYVIDFLGLKGRYTEKQLEDAIITQLEQLCDEKRGNRQELREGITVQSEKFWYNTTFEQIVRKLRSLGLRISKSTLGDNVHRAIEYMCGKMSEWWEK